MTVWRYLPILKWKQGERIALRNLTPIQWGGVVPLVELLPIEVAPNFAALQLELPSYVAKIAKDLVKVIPDDVCVAIDTRYVSIGYPKQLQLLSAICKRLSKLSDRKLIPVVTSTNIQNEPDQLGRLEGHFKEYMIRIDNPSVNVAQVKPIIALMKQAFKQSPVHVVVDQFSLVGDTPAAAAESAKPYLDAALSSGVASVTLAGGSFPVNLMGFKQGTFDIERVEWMVWKQIIQDSAYAKLRYADYSVSHPALAPNMDPKQVNPSVAIRYAADNFWRLFKAGGFKKGTPNQYMSLCQLLMSDVVYTDPTYSFGDKCYADAAAAKLGNGNPSSWRRDATNHHLVLTRRAL